LDIGILGYIGVIQHYEHSPEVWQIPPGTSYIYSCFDGFFEEDGTNYVLLGYPTPNTNLL
jgi:hypothetical protein